MAVVTCPKCATTLRIPDGVSGNVKCPKCSNLFPVTAPATPIAKNPAASLTKSAAIKPAAAPPKTLPKEPEEPDFEVVEEPQPKKKVAATIEDDEDDKPRNRKKLDDDNEPRRRKKVDEDDDDEDRPRKKTKSRRYEDDDDDEDWQPKRRSKKGRDKARIGMLLLTISSWLYFSLYVLFTLCVFLMLVSFLVASESTNSRASSGSSSTKPGDIASLINIVLILLGLIGLGNWIVSLVGFSFCIAGPARTRAKAITITAIAGVHLMFVGLSYSITSNMLSGLGRFGGIESPSWLIFATTLPFLNSFLPALAYGSRSINGEAIVLLLTGVFEAVRLIFSLLTIRDLAIESKNDPAAEKAQLGVVASSIVIGGGMILMLFIVLLVVEAKCSNFKTPITIGLVALFLLCLAYTVMLLLPALTAGSTQRSLAQRNR